MLNDIESKRFIKAEEKSNVMFLINDAIYPKKSKYSFKIEYDSSKNKFISRNKFSKINRLTKPPNKKILQLPSLENNKIFHRIEPLLKEYPKSRTPRASFLSLENKSLYHINKIKNINTLTPKNNNESKKDVKDIIFKFKYDEKNKIEPMNLNLYKDSIEEQEKEYEKYVEEEYTNKKKYFFSSEKKPDLMNKKNLNISVDLKSIIKKYEINHMNKNIDNGFNLTQKQMNLLSKDANILFEKYKNNLRNNNIGFVDNNFKIKNNKIKGIISNNKIKIKKMKFYPITPNSKKIKF